MPELTPLPYSTAPLSNRIACTCAPSYNEAYYTDAEHLSIYAFDYQEKQYRKPTRKYSR